jgi:hypothetical protein
MTNIFARKKSKSKSVANQFMIKFKKISDEHWRLTTPSFVRVWQTSDSLKDFLKKVNEAAKDDHYKDCYQINDASLRARVSYLRNYRKLPLLEHEDESDLWDRQESNRIDWESLRKFCDDTK